MVKNKSVAITDQKILKAVLMLRKLGNTYTSKEEQIAEQKEWIANGYYSDGSFDEWIDWMRDELAKTPEQREEESRSACEEMAEREAEMEYQERMASRHYRDEWDDLWDDRARSVGAMMF